MYEDLIQYCKDEVQSSTPFLSIGCTHIAISSSSNTKLLNLNHTAISSSASFGTIQNHDGTTQSSLLSPISSKNEMMKKSLSNHHHQNVEQSQHQHMPFKSVQAVNFSNLKVCFDKAEYLQSREGWRESFRKFMLSVLEETPISILRVCCLIAHDSVPLELFCACFISIWLKLTEKEQNEIIHYLELALKNSDVQDVIKTILNLAEFMERCDTPLPLDNRLLAQKAFHVRAYAKSLHYVEEQFNVAAATHVSNDVLEQLVILNHELQKPEAAAGVLDYASKNVKNLDQRGKERWYEKLHDWQKALNAYEKDLSLEQPAALNAPSANAIPTSYGIDPKTLNNSKLDLLTGKMRCLKGLGEWSKLNTSCKDLLTCLESINITKQDPVDDLSQRLSSFHSVINISDQTFTYNSSLTRIGTRRQMSSINTNDNHLNLTQQQFQNLRSKVAEMGAAASWGLNDWDSMNNYVKYLPDKSYDGSLYRGILALTKNDFKDALEHICEARDLLDGDLTSMASQSYDRAYQAIVDTQVLAELEEIITYKTNPQKCEGLHECWWKRLEGCERTIEYWHRLLLVRSIVLPKEKDIKPWLKFSSLCEKTGQLNLTNQILTSLLSKCGVVEKRGLQLDLLPTSYNNLNNNYDQCKYAYLKYLWSSSQRKDAYDQLKDFVFSNLTSRHDQHIQQLQQQQQNPINGLRDVQQYSDDLNRLLSKSYLKLGRWQHELEGFQDITIQQIIGFYQHAKEHNKTSYKAWNAWAYANYEAIQYYKANPQSAQALSTTPPSRQTSRQSTSSNNLFSLSSPSLPEPRMNRYIKPAIQGFFNCIKLSSGTALQETNSLQDTLRLLTLWFDYCNSSDICDTLADGISSTSMEIWLQVIPQLIARIDTTKPFVAQLLHKLLMDLGRHHPQALVYRLILSSKCSNTIGTTAAAIVASTTSQTSRSIAASKILQSLREHSNTLVEQAKLVSEELIRVAILWHELWHESLEDASKQYFAEKNVNGMLETLEVLHNMMDRGPTTSKESAFLQAYGRDLAEAREFCMLYKQTRNTKNIEQAWEKYYHVFKRITRQLPQMISLELIHVSPKLMQSRDLELAVPGTYEPHKPLIRIKSFHPNIQVIQSKQRPRKISIFGSNGYEYVFLLKGHEDLRQDERVMQIFGLVNNLLLKNQETARRDLAIQRYSVIPLSQNSGLLEWLLNCDTLHSLIREYRERKKIALNIEHRIITKLAPDYEHLTPIQKVEIFETAIENSSGDDLAKILWYKSVTAEKWLDRRTNFTRSLAVMSMVGYVLGLGDRHPSNLMLDRTNGKIIHVDFGDCFETAMTREKFPEKIPFRLTRMLKNAMEVTGIEGTFRHTCESVMKVLRMNRESVMAVLEAFVYDPLIYWRLMEGNNNTNNRLHGSNNSIGIGSNPDANNLSGDNVSISSIGLIDNNSFGNNNLQQIPDDYGEEGNRNAIRVLKRVKDKLTGYDFGDKLPIDERRQVDLLIKQATSGENLCQCFIGWCAWW